MSGLPWRETGGSYCVDGELSRDTVPELWGCLSQWQPEQSEVEISLEQTERIDSAGMVLLIHLIQHAKNSNCHIMLSFVPKQLQMLLQLSNIEAMMVDHIKD